MRRAGGSLRLGTTVEASTSTETALPSARPRGPVACAALVVATGGKSIPKMGATGFGYELAAQFGLRVTETRPGLVPLTFEPALLERLKPLAGVSTRRRASPAARQRFDEAMLFTHRGLSRPRHPADLRPIGARARRSTSTWLPGVDVLDVLRGARDATRRSWRCRPCWPTTCRSAWPS